MSAKEALQALLQIKSDLDDNPIINLAINVVLASRRPFGNEEDELRRLILGPNLQNQFRAIVQDAVRGELSLIRYEPGYKPDSDEICWLDLGDVPGGATVADRIAAFQNLVLFDGNHSQFTDYLVYYALHARVNAQRRVTLFRKASDKLELGRSNKLAALFGEGRYDTVQESMLLFDRRIDCWTDGNYVFIANIPNFEKVFRYVEKLEARAVETVTEILKRIPIANADAFREACTGQHRFMNKLAVIAQRPYLQHIGMDAFKRVIKMHDLDIEIVRENGEQKLKFDPDPSRRWILLKLLDDDYLNSIMTRLKYEVNSKIPRKVPTRAKPTN